MERIVGNSSTDFIYNMIIRQNLLKKLGSVLDFRADMMIWHNVAVPMNDLDTSMEQ